ncbi:MAG: glutamyl-tRNA reductase [Firmicutes bacterium]|nr:glutamyl-tRNA reductase [Bacillota bacterium]
MFIVVVGLNHKTAPVEVRERLAISAAALSERLAEVKQLPSVEGVVILSTCNRTEIYAAVTDIERSLAGIREVMARVAGVDMTELKQYLYSPTCHDAIAHLFRVAAGLDSMIIGETQILGQVREAYQLACEYGASNGVLNTLFQQAITVGKRVRTETAIDRHAVSISYAAVELAKQIFGRLDGCTTLIIGAGEMSELTARHLVANGVVSVLVSNRSYERAVELATQFGGVAVKFDQLSRYLERADIVISCTAACHYVVHPAAVEQAMQAREGRKIFMIDIAVPRDIDPAVANIPGVYLYDIDDLQHVVDSNLMERQKEAVKAEKIIQQEIIEFNNWLNSLFVVPTIRALKEKGERIKQTELQRAFNRLGTVSPREEKIIQSLANSIVNQLLHDPVIQLKRYATTHQGHLYTEVLQNLFNLEIEGQRLKTASEKTEVVAES